MDQASRIQHAQNALQEKGIDPSQLSEDQMNAFVAASDSVQTGSIEVLLKNIDFLTPDDLLQRSQILLEELKAFADLCERKKYHAEYRHQVQYTQFRSDVLAEVNVMEKVKKTSGMSPERVQQLLKSSNLPYLEAIWDTAKRSSAITTLKRRGSVVDIIADGGLKWIKVSTMTEKRLLMEMASKGWNWHGISDDEDQDSESNEGPANNKSDVVDDDEDDVWLVKMARGLVRSTKDIRVKYMRPQVHIVLPRISSGNEDIDAVLDQVRATGAIVRTADQILPPPPLGDVLENLVVDEFKSFSRTLNVDCTILLAVVSDISHGQVKKIPLYNYDIRRQIEAEQIEPLMPNLLWPAMVGHDLVCTQLAAQRMREISDLIGTESEKARTSIIMGDDSTKSSAELRSELQQYSRHIIPNNWNLPIRIYDATPEKISLVAQTVREQLQDVTRSVFMSGWASGYTTITSNRVAFKAIEKTVEDNKKSEDEFGPIIWVCPIARSLVAKEKERRDTPGQLAKEEKRDWQAAKHLAIRET